MTLLDAIRKRKENIKKPAIEGNTEAAQRILRAKSGKATPINTIAIGTGGEQAVSQQLGTTLTQAQQAARIESSGLEQQAAAQQQQAEQRQALLSQRDLEQEQQRQLQLANLQNTYQNNLTSLGLDKQKAAAESRIFIRKMESKKYLNDLKNEGMLKRLDNKVEFTKEVQKAITGYNVTEELQRQGLEALISGDRRQGEKELSKISPENKIELARLTIEASNRRAIIEGVAEGGAAAATKKPNP